jgi:putative transposase
VDTRVPRRAKGSKRRAKAARQCGKRYQHVRRRRRDFHHKAALALVRQYDTISVEAIAPASLVRRPAPLPSGSGGYRHNGARRKAGLNTGIHDAG